jgi:hypothetical protein
MEGNVERSPEIEELPMALVTEASLRSQVTDPLLGRLGDARGRRLTLEQWDVRQEIEAALEAYRSYFYPPEHR